VHVHVIMDEVDSVCGEANGEDLHGEPDVDKQGRYLCGHGGCQQRFKRRCDWR
jgi:hypothetical protein